MKDFSFACPDWVERLKAGQTPIPDLPVDEIEAGAAVALFNKLRVPDIPGQPHMADAAGEWIRDIIRAAFGMVEFVDDVTRPGEKMMVRHAGELFVLVPKKNAKTTNAAAIGLVAMLMNKTPNIDGVIIGPTQEVADKCFAQAAAMIEADDYLRRRFKIIDHRKTIIDREIDERSGRPRNAKLKVKSFDPKVVTGSIPAFAIMDELHVMAESHHAGRVIGQIRGGMVTNAESLLIFITTQSEVPPFGVFKDELEYARKVRDGIITEGVRMLPVLYEFPKDVQASEGKTWRNPELWPMVLPNLNRSLRLDRLVGEYRQAVDKGIAEEVRWASQHLNIEIGLGLHGNSWSGAVHWQGAGDQAISFEYLLEWSEVITIGGDWGGADDLAALAFLGRHKVSKKWMVWVHAWARPSVLVARKSIASRLQDFAGHGHLSIVATGDAQAEEAADMCARVHAAGLLPEEFGIGLDVAGIAIFQDALAERGMEPPLVNNVPQGWKLNSVISGLPLKLEAKKLLHGCQPIMGWAVGNAKQELKGSNYVVTKELAGAGKIDPLIALFNAAVYMDRNPVAATKATIRARTL